MTRFLTTTTAIALGMVGAAQAQTSTEVLDTYANIAQANYEDSLSVARDLETAITALIYAPSAETRQAARHTWLESRVTYQQTEVSRCP
ncbi:MAG: hypothetical protein CMG88_03270 [Marinobacter sp.]|nr:hypothetical protein [Paracoccaceae bacterium]MBP53565.1 hypothetical protein [Marinobacter sp.]